MDWDAGLSIDGVEVEDLSAVAESLRDERAKPDGDRLRIGVRPLRRASWQDVVIVLDGLKNDLHGEAFWLGDFPVELAWQ